MGERREVAKRIRLIAVIRNEPVLRRANRREVPTASSALHWKESQPRRAAADSVVSGRPPFRVPTEQRKKGGRKHSPYESGLDDFFSLADVSALAESRGMPAEKLAQLVDLIADRFQTAVRSAYLLEPDRNSMVLAATHGRQPHCVGKLRLQLSEGLAERVGPVAVEHARSHPRF